MLLDAGLTTAGDALVRAALVLAAVVLSRLLIGSALVALVRVPGRIGRGASRVAQVLRPGLVGRTTGVVLGLGLALVDVAATAAGASAAPARDAGAQHVAPRDLHHAAPTRAGHGAVDLAVVVVRPGDTLWDIARHHLPAGATAGDVARAWPRWYAANRAAIGPDPALLRPGTQLRSPERRRTGTSAPSYDRPSATPTAPGAVARSLDPDRR